MKKFKYALCLAATALPTLSNIGYPVYSLEYITFAVLSLVFGAAIYCLKWSLLQTIIYSVLLIIYTLFITTVIHRHPEIQLFYFVIIILIINILIYSGKESAQKTIHAMFMAQIVVAAFSTQSSYEVIVNRPVTSNSAPDVIHLLLDEHGGLAAIPTSANRQDTIHAIEKAYLNRGFIVFRQAYSADIGTHQTVTRLFNDTYSEENNFSSLPVGFLIKKAELFERLGKTHWLKVIYPDWLDLKNVLRNSPNTGYAASYGNYPYEVYPTFDNNLRNRLKLAGGFALHFLTSGLVGDFFTQKLAHRTHGIVAMHMFNTLIEHINEDKTGRYLYAHFLIPHDPYLFRKDCSLKPQSEWRTRRLRLQGEFYKGKDPLSIRSELWGLHIDQAWCVTQKVSQLVDKVMSDKNKVNTVFFIHGDHGSRIDVENFSKDIPEKLYNAKDYQRDMRGTFLAVKIPGTKAQLIDKPVRLDDVYHQLVKNNFLKLDVDALPKRADSVY